MNNRRKFIKLTGYLSLLLTIAVAGYSVSSKEKSDEGRSFAPQKRIFLIGASVGKDWKLQEFSKRTKSDKLMFESVAVYQYDKSEALEEVLIRPKRKFHLTRTYLKGFFKPAPQPPDTIILKECSAYFPGDMDLYKRQVREWVKRIREVNLEAVLATVVPVTETRSEKDKGKMEAIREYNDWIREYSSEEKIIVLDLESVLRTDDRKRFLKEEFAVEDGVHLNKRAYDILDRLLEETFKTI